MVVENQLKLHRWALWVVVKLLAFHLNLDKYSIGGSFKRGKWWCNDIDLVVPISTEMEGWGIEARLKQLGWRLRPRGEGHEEIFSRQFLKQVGKKYLVMDLFLVPPGCWGNAMMFTTGPRSHNDRVRADILKLGYSWANPRYFTHIKSNKPISFSNEKAAFKFLGMPYVKPKNRL